MGRPRVAIVIPAVNEAKTIAVVVEVAAKYGVPIVVDDGSSDNTVEVAIRAGAVIVTHTRNLGYDAALNSGFERATELGSEIIITADADGQHDLSLISNFVGAIDAGADVVVGCRRRRQRFAEYIFAWYANVRFGIKDPLCGMKAYRTPVYNLLGHFDSYGSVGTELMIFAARHGFRISQVECGVRERRGQSRFGQTLVGNCRIIRALLHTALLVK
jgi:glycosyltransferase involved in cell wall biosynthesis